MSYQSIHIPFYTGQDEKYDEKVLPNGPMHAVFNMFLERDGRMVRRPRLELKGQHNAKDNFINVECLEFAEPNSIVVEYDSHERLVRHWSPDDTDEPTILEQGRLPLYTNVQHIRAATNTSGGGNDDLAEAASQVQPTADVDVNGNLVFCYTQGTLITIEIREPKTFRIIHSIVKETASTSNFGVKIIPKVVASKKTARVALVWYMALPGFAYSIAIDIYETDGDFNHITQNLLYNAGTDLNLLFDADSRPDTDSFILGFNINPAAPLDWVLREYSFDDASELEEHDTATLVYADGHCGVHCSKTRWYWGFSDHSTGNAGTLELRSGEWNGGALQTHSIDATTEYNQIRLDFWSGGVSGYPFSGPQFASNGADECFVSYSYLPTGGAFRALYTTACFTTWDHVADSLSHDFRYCELAISGPVTHSKVEEAGEATFCFLSEQAYYSEDDTTLEFEPTRVGNILASRSQVYAAATVVRGGIQTLSSTVPYVSGGQEYIHFNDHVPPHAVKFDVDGVTRVIYPTEVTTTGLSRVNSQDSEVILPKKECLWVSCDLASSLPTKVRSGETLFPGGALSANDETRVIQAFTGPPHFISASAGLTTSPPAFIEEGVVLVAGVLEYRDANGRTWRSAPSVIRSIQTDPPEPITPRYNVVNATFTIPLLAGQAEGAKLIIYASNLGGTILYKREELPAVGGRMVSFGWYNLPELDTGETLYTATGEVSNNAPPSCQFVTNTRNRVWAGGLTDRSAVQASKPLNDIQGVHWSDFDNFKVFLPDDVTGMAPMDDSLVVFTRDHVYAVHGAGPDSAAVGVFAEPQVIPGSSGCIESRSVVASEVGVFYQSLRGIEIVPRGFATPQWIGQNVRDTLEEFPVCKGSCQSPLSWDIRWLFHNTDGTEARTIIFDLRSKSWYVHAHDPSSGIFDIIGTCTGRAGDPDHVAMFLGSKSSSTNSSIEDTTEGREALSDDEAYLETGSLRVAGLQSWGFGRRAHIFGTFGGRACNVTLEFAFNDEDFLPIDTFTWNLTTADRAVNSPVELELTLPVQQFSAVRFRVKVEALSDATDSQFTFKANGLSVYYTPAPEGPRLASRDKG